MMKDARRQDIAANHSQCRRRFFGLRLFNNGRHLLDALADGTGGHNAVAPGIGTRHILHAEDRRPVLAKNIDHLPHDRHLAIQQIVGKKHGKGLITDHRLRAQHRVP